MTLGKQQVGIIGAGLSGLMAGRILQDRGVNVTLFDKGRRPGGRANTREHGPHRFDHGAQFFTVRDPEVRGYLDSWIDAGIVAEWRGALVRIKGGAMEPATDSVRYVGVPGMISLPSALAEGLDVRVETRVKKLSFEDPGWSLWDVNEADLGSFDSVLVALPSHQAAEFLSHAPEMQAQVQNVEMAPCWAGMFVFERPLALDFDGAFLAEEALSWIARDSSKPGRPRVEAWIVHANPEWSRRNLSMDRVQAATALLREFQALFGFIPDPVFQRGHRWGFSSGSDPSARGAFFNAGLGIGACGDWCMGGRIEGALLSGVAAADHILAAQAVDS